MEEIHKFSELNQKQLEISGCKFDLKELTGPKAFRWQRLLKHLPKVKDEQDQVQTCYEIVNLILSGVNDEWMNNHLSLDRLVELIEIQNTLNRMNELEAKAQSLLPLIGLRGEE